MTSHNELIKIDNNHISLIYSLLISHKPNTCLELGIGSGATTQKIIEAFEYNNIPLNIDCVDNFYDWGGKCPEHILKIKNINIVVSTEYDFITQTNKKYDFIISDADHNNAHRWVDKMFNILNPNGIIVYHDITNNIFPNLYSIVNYVKNQKLNHILFTRNSRNDERCDRGLLVVFS